MSPNNVRNVQEPNKIHLWQVTLLHESLPAFISFQGMFSFSPPATRLNRWTAHQRITGSQKKKCLIARILHSIIFFKNVFCHFSQMSCTEHRTDTSWALAANNLLWTYMMRHNGTHRSGKNESELLYGSSSHTVNEPTAQHLHKRSAATRKQSLTQPCTHVEKSDKAKGWWWLWHIAMPPTVVPVRGQSTSNWTSVTHALCQSSYPALACNAWHIAEPPTGLLSLCPADDGGRGAAKETDFAGLPSGCWRNGVSVYTLKRLLRLGHAALWDIALWPGSTVSNFKNNPKCHLDLRTWMYFWTSSAVASHSELNMWKHVANRPLGPTIGASFWAQGYSLHAVCA